MAIMIAIFNLDDSDEQLRGIKENGEMKSHVMGLLCNTTPYHISVVGDTFREELKREHLIKCLSSLSA